MRPIRTLSLPLFSALVVVACSASVEAHPPVAHVTSCDATARSGSVTVHVTDEYGSPLSTYAYRGETWVLGQRGNRYKIRIHNGSGERLEAVVSVDGRDAIDGKPASTSKRGYLVPAYGDVTIDGFRLSSAEVAAFRFSSVSQSYAAKMGAPRDVGVIGVALFREKHRPQPVYRPEPYRPRRDYDGGGETGRYDKRKGESYEDAPRSQAEGRPSAPKAGGSYAERERPGLGTEFGERHTSHVREVAFVRGSSHPSQIIALRYNDARGLQAAGVDMQCRRPERYDDEHDAWLRRTARPFAETSRGWAAPPPGWRD